jgi:alpha-glucosidase
LPDSKNFCWQGAISLNVFMEENTVDPKLELNKVAAEEEVFQHVNNPIIGIKPIQKKYLGIPNHADQIGNKFFFTDGEAKVEIVVVTDEIIRVQTCATRCFPGRVFVRCA